MSSSRVKAAMIFGWVGSGQPPTEDMVNVDHFNNCPRQGFFFSFSPAQFPHVDLITTEFTLFRQTRRQKKPKIKNERCVLSQQSESKEKKIF